MTFDLRQLIGSHCPNLGHALVAVGTVNNGQLAVPDAIAQLILIKCQDEHYELPTFTTSAPPSSFPGTTRSPVSFTGRLRTDVEKSPLRAICAACEKNVAGECRGSNCCGGQIPVEVRLNLTSTGCPKGRWPATAI